MDTSKIDIKKWFAIERKTNGKVKIKFNESGIYKSLKDSGLNYSRIDGKGEFYIRNSDSLTVTHFNRFTGQVWDYIKNLGEESFPKEISKQVFISSFFNTSVIKKNDLLKYILRDELSESEKHKLKLQTDGNYRKRTEIEDTIKKLNELGFKMTVDNEGEFGKNDIYYKRLLDDRYIVINHYCKDKKIELQGFDCWNAVYKKEKDVGVKKPLSMDSLRLSFHIDRDLALIDQRAE